MIYTSVSVESEVNLTVAYRNSPDRESASSFTVFAAVAINAPCVDENLMSRTPASLGTMAVTVAVSCLANRITGLST